MRKIFAIACLFSIILAASANAQDATAPSTAPAVDAQNLAAPPTSLTDTAPAPTAAATEPADLSPSSLPPAEEVKPNINDTVLEKPKAAPKKPKKKVVKRPSGTPASMSAHKSGSYSPEAPVAPAPAHSGNFGELHNTLQGYFPKENVGVKQIGSSLVVSGVVNDAEIASRIIQITENYAGRAGLSVTNLLQIKTSQQVMLRVRIGEVNRTALKKYGIAGLASMEKDGLVKILAEPNLTAINGETATFLSGGEIPVPVQSNSGMGVNYKNYGVGLEFTPYVLSQNRIRLNVSSEVSQLTTEGAVQTPNATIPALASRKAKTTVELAPGESFMIAGMIKDNLSTGTGGATPLSNIPVIGSLLRGSDIERDETELVISVTPYLVNPVKASDIKLPTDGYRPPSTLENIFMGSLGSNSGNKKVQTQLPGGEKPAEGIFGYMID